eukprot:366053-Chlamydomonas_euryale.AAC.6
MAAEKPGPHRLHVAWQLKSPVRIACMLHGSWKARSAPHACCMAAENSDPHGSWTARSASHAYRHVANQRTHSSS